MPFFYYPMSSTYMIGYLLVAIGSVIMIVAQLKVSSAYNKYEKVPNSRQMTGAMVAREIRSKWIERCSNQSHKWKIIGSLRST